jgi:hypothetical protein
MRGGQIFRGVTREQFLTHDDTTAKANTGVSAIPGKSRKLPRKLYRSLHLRARACEPQPGTPFALGPTALKNLMET